MKIGLVGFKSGVSTAKYAELIKDLYKQNGFDGEPELVLSEMDFLEFENLRVRGRWDVIQNMLEAVIKEDLKEADFCIIASVYTHRLFRHLVEATGKVIVHVADPIGEYLVREGLEKVLLLGTKETMESDFVSSILRQSYGIETIIPDEADRNYLDHVIYRELTLGMVRDESRNNVINIIKKGKDRGAQAVLQASTEWPMLFSEDDLPQWAYLPVVNAMKIHAEAALNWALD